MVLKNLIPFFKSDNTSNTPPSSPVAQPIPTAIPQTFQPLTPENRQRDNDQIAALALSPRNQPTTTRTFRSPSISISTTTQQNTSQQQQQPSSNNNTTVVGGGSGQTSPPSSPSSPSRSRAISSPFTFTRKRGISNTSNGSNESAASSPRNNGLVNTNNNAFGTSSQQQQQVVAQRKSSREERRRQLFREFEMNKVIIYSNCKRLRALLDVLIERARPHQVQNVSYVLAQMSVVESTGLPPTTENDLKVVKSELNSINLEIFRLTLLISESYKQEVFHTNLSSGTNHEARSPTCIIEDEQMFGNVSCESVILKIIGRELSDLERDLERMHRRCRGNKKKPVEPPAQPKRSNSIFGRRRGASALERPSSMVLGNQDSKKRHSMDFYRSTTIDELGQAVMEKVIERVQNSQFRTVTKELHVEQGILMLLEKRFAEVLNNIRRGDIDIYNPVRLSDLLTESYWKNFLSKQMSFTEGEYQQVLNSFLITVQQQYQKIQDDDEGQAPTNTSNVTQPLPPVDSNEILIHSEQLDNLNVQ